MKPGGCPAGAAFGRSPDGNAFEGAESGICADPRAFVLLRALRSSSGGGGERTAAVRGPAAGHSGENRAATGKALGGPAGLLPPMTPGRPALWAGVPVLWGKVWAKAREGGKRHTGEIRAVFFAKFSKKYPRRMCQSFCSDKQIVTAMLRNFEQR